ncbi:MAG: molecular chaperone [Nitrospiraceae bacterium]
MQSEGQHTLMASGDLASDQAAARRIAECRAQAGLYRLLGRCLEDEVDDELLDLLRGELRAPLAEVGMTLDEAFFQASPQALLETLAVEFTGLFVAPGGVSPYASVFETGRMFQEPADRAATAYRLAGWQYQRRLSGEFADHIGTMLAFMGMLSDAEAAALEEGNQALADTWRQHWNTFLVQQLGRWAPGWCRRAAEATLHGFYNELLALTEKVLWDDLAACTDRRRLKELAELNRREPVKPKYDADFRKASGL